MVESKNFAMQVLKKQLKGTCAHSLGIELSSSEEHEGWSFGLEDDNNLFKWTLMFSGPSETLYEVWLLLSDPFSGRLLQGAAHFSLGLPLQPARDAVQDRDVAPEQ